MTRESTAQRGEHSIVKDGVHQLAASAALPPPSDPPGSSRVRNPPLPRTIQLTQMVSQPHAKQDAKCSPSAAVGIWNYSGIWNGPQKLGMEGFVPSPGATRRRIFGVWLSGRRCACKEDQLPFPLCPRHPKKSRFLCPMLPP